MSVLVYMRSKDLITQSPHKRAHLTLPVNILQRERNFNFSFGRDIQTLVMDFVDNRLNKKK